MVDREKKILISANFPNFPFGFSSLKERRQIKVGDVLRVTGAARNG
jgi:hypothetical protein